MRPLNDGGRWRVREPAAMGLSAGPRTGDVPRPGQGDTGCLVGHDAWRMRDDGRGRTRLSRSSDELRLGTLAFSVSCMRPGDRIVVVGTLWTDHDRLKQARYLDAFLNRVERRCQIALWQSRIIEAPTDSPVIAITPPS